MIRFNGITIDRKQMTISHRGREVFFGGRWYQSPAKRGAKFELMNHLILGGGLSKEQIFEWRYADDVDGGPINGTNVVAVWMSQLTVRIAALDLHLRKESRGGKNIYWLEPNVV